MKEQLENANDIIWDLLAQNTIQDKTLKEKHIFLHEILKQKDEKVNNVLEGVEKIVDSLVDAGIVIDDGNDDEELFYAKNDEKNDEDVDEHEDINMNENNVEDHEDVDVNDNEDDVVEGKKEGKKEMGMEEYEEKAYAEWINDEILNTEKDD